MIEETVDDHITKIHDALENGELMSNEKMEVIKQILQQAENGHQSLDAHPKDSVNVTTVGMIVHSMSDGLALGCAFFFSNLLPKLKGADNKNFGYFIFFAILMDKIPAALGFGTFLQHKALPFKEVMKYLVFFTATCPIVSIITYLLLESLDFSNKFKELQYLTGVLLLGSSGTFLYVATIHVLPEVYCTDDPDMQNV